MRRSSPFVSITVLLAAAAAVAQPAPTQPGPPRPIAPSVAPSQAPAAAPQQPGLVLSPQLCAQLRAQTMNGADYVPGVDAYGRPVTPADLPNSGAQGIGTTTTDILVDPSRRLPPQVNGYAQTLAAQVTVGPGGAVRINGQPIGQDTAQSLRNLCTQQGY